MSNINASGKDRSYFKAAKAIAESSDHRHKLGCVIIHKHRIISSACNSNTKCHPIQAELDRKMFHEDCAGKLHAEVAAIIPLLKYKIDLSGATVYTYREHRDGSIAMARPCARCMSFIKKCGIKRLKYTTSDGFASEVIV